MEVRSEVAFTFRQLPVGFQFSPGQEPRGLNGETKKDDYHKMELCFCMERIANHPKKELYLKVLEVYELNMSER
jgi:hypothetical protein